MLNGPLVASRDVLKLFSEDELRRIAKFTSSERTSRPSPPQLPSPTKAKWPDVVKALAAVATIGIGLATKAFVSYPWLIPTLLVGSLVIGAGAVYFPVAKGVVERKRNRREAKARELDEEDRLLVRAAAIVRLAGLCYSLTVHEGSSRATDIGFLQGFAHGPRADRLRERFGDAIVALRNIAEVILSSRPALREELLNTWARKLQDQAGVFHQAVVPLVALAPSLPLDIANRQEAITLGHQAYERYQDFWKRFSEGSGAEVAWPFGSDPLLPDRSLMLAPLQLPPPTTG